MKNKSLVTITNLYFLDWNKCLTITKTTLLLIKQEARIKKIHQDSYSNIEIWYKYKIFNATMINNKYIDLIENYNIVNSNMNDNKHLVDKYLDSIRRDSTPQILTQIFWSNLDLSTQPKGFTTHKKLNIEELSLRKNIIYDYTIRARNKTVHMHNM